MAKHLYLHMTNLSKLALLSTKDYTYHLPESRIALFPANPRHSSKLLSYRMGAITHHKSFLDILSLLPEKSILLANNTKVIPARLSFRKSTGAPIEIFLLEPSSHQGNIQEAMKSISSCSWKCLIRNLKKWKPEEILEHPSSTFSATLIDKENMTVRFNWNTNLSFNEIVSQIGTTPLPPYINRPNETSDSESYQTRFSSIQGAVAAPTAGLHFSEDILQKLQTAEHCVETVTLHVSAGTFQPLKVERVFDHAMHQEQIGIKKETIKRLLLKKPLVAIGTTSLRTIESLIWYGYELIKNPEAPFFVPKIPYLITPSNTPEQALLALLDKMKRDDNDELWGKTEIMILPGYKFQLVQHLITNFHQPNSTLLLLIAAFIGNDWGKVYESALEHNYRFLSYGDACFLSRNEF